MENLKLQAIELFKNYPYNINTNLLQRNLKIELIKVNKLIELLENEGIITKRDENGKRSIVRLE